MWSLSSVIIKSTNWKTSQNWKESDGHLFFVQNSASKKAIKLLQQTSNGFPFFLLFFSSKTNTLHSLVGRNHRFFFSFLVGAWIDEVRCFWVQNSAHIVVIWILNERVIHFLSQKRFFFSIWNKYSIVLFGKNHRFFFSSLVRPSIAEVSCFHV